MISTRRRDHISKYRTSNQKKSASWVPWSTNISLSYFLDIRHSHIWNPSFSCEIFFPDPVERFYVSGWNYKGPPHDAETGVKLPISKKRATTHLNLCHVTLHVYHFIINYCSKGACPTKLFGPYKDGETNIIHACKQEYFHFKKYELTLKLFI
jgi:hypothetical protein